ncbi:MAG: Mur ligase family protein [Sphaerochaetaceae bacterium]
MKKLSDFVQIAGDDAPIAIADVPIAGLSYDSRQCRKGWAFFAFLPISGGADGQEFIADALKSGAAAIICTRNRYTMNLAADNPSARFIFCTNPQAQYAAWCRIFFGAPDEGLQIIGVTGTDGKTSTCAFLHQLLSAQGIRTGLLSTVSLDDGTGLCDSPYRQSTPEADQIYAFLSRCRANGVRVVIMETTSHALSPATSRLSQLRFSGAIYTTISSEHLEFHKTIADYVDCKLNLARQTISDGFVLYPNDSPYADKIIESFRGNRISGYDLDNLKITSQQLDHLDFYEKHQMEAAMRETADCAVTENADCAGGEEPKAPEKSRMQTLTRFCYGPEMFLSNAIAALEAAGLIIGKPLSPGLLSNLRPIKGRMEVIRTDNGTFLIDFAHTADSYERLFSFVRRVCPGKQLIALFSSGGRRDSVKRPRLGEIASRNCQAIILTNEDPRDEGFDRITSDIMRGIDAARTAVYFIPDRKEAIRKAVNLSDSDTITLLLGKGHEKTIEFEKGRKVSWDEMKALKEVLQESQCSMRHLSRKEVSQ